MLLQVQDAGYDGIHDEAGYLRHYGQSIDFIDANPKPQAFPNRGVPREDPRDASPALVLVIRTPAWPRIERTWLRDWAPMSAMNVASPD